MAGYDITLANVSAPVISEADKKTELYLPLGSLYLISAWERAGWRVDFRDYQVRSGTSAAAAAGSSAGSPAGPLDPHSLADFLEGAAPIVGISCMVSMLPFVVLGTRRFKERHPEATIILGGPGPSGVAKALLESMPWIDVVARGEGEITAVELLRALTGGGDLSGVKGITYRRDGQVCENPPRARITNLDDLPLPAYHSVDLSRYTNFSVVTGRGCPFNCSFCDVGPLWENRVLLRGVDGVLKELETLRRTYGIERVNFADDTFTLQRSRTEALLREVGHLGLSWSCLSRIDKLDEELLAKMASAGCDAIFFGIESGSNRVLSRIDKRFTIEEATEKVELTTRYVKQIITSYIWGFPFETMDDFKSTIFSILSMWHLGARAGLKLLSPMPLSRLGIEFRDRIEFSEKLCSVFASLGNITSGMSGKRADIPQEFKEIIRQYPDVFEGFYFIKSDGLEEKARYLERFCEKFKIPV